MGVKKCSKCNREFDGQSYEIGSKLQCCKSCYDYERKMNLVKCDPDARRLYRQNNCATIVGLLAATISLICLIASICCDYNVWLRVGIFAPWVITGFTIYCNQRLDAKLIKIFKEKLPDAEFDGDVAI